MEFNSVKAYTALSPASHHLLKRPLLSQKKNPGVCLFPWHPFKGHKQLFQRNIVVPASTTRSLMKFINCGHYRAKFAQYFVKSRKNRYKTFYDKALKTFFQFTSVFLN